MGRILVIGVGTMGASISQLAAQAGYYYGVMQDRGPRFIEKGQQYFVDRLNRQAKQVLDFGTCFC
ncbi:MAG: 3-hydroxyacyl-CoA dehydrogenase NAD-binding domain-containing protein [Peptococcaceae bacterium]|nr:3-hydroxyacyl-CoA dehydrogenase NAD-binding domain-containing protein [Peptococcaceae bacterium]MDH7526394.1 3-hydroxyacyl-CoA dehydrogenase NAD-binding domain-containing protein [Peptococcaceae bacterium]